MSLLHRAWSLTRRMDDASVIRWRLGATLSPGYRGLVIGPSLTAGSLPYRWGIVIYRAPPWKEKLSSRVLSSRRD
jgi:hypothetical protein